MVASQAEREDAAVSIYSGLAKLAELALGELKEDAGKRIACAEYLGAIADAMSGICDEFDAGREPVGLCSELSHYADNVEVVVERLDVELAREIGYLVTQGHLVRTNLQESLRWSGLHMNRFGGRERMQALRAIAGRLRGFGNTLRATAG